MRTTIDIDDLILKDLKRLQRREGKSLGRLVSDLLAQALLESRSTSAPVTPFRWTSQSMGARVDLADNTAFGRRDGRPEAMSFGIDVNVLLYASDRGSPFHPAAAGFLQKCAAEPEVFCLAWISLLATFGWQRIRRSLPSRCRTIIGRASDARRESHVPNRSATSPVDWEILGPVSCGA